MTVDLATVRVLYVEDEDLLREVVGGVLQDFCRQAWVTQDGAAALERFVRDGADVVVTDLSMPVMDGFELITRIRARDRDVPILVTTAHSHLDERALSLGASRCLLKPFDMKELLEAVASAIGPRPSAAAPGLSDCND